MATAGAILLSTVESSSFPSFLLELDLPPLPNNDDDDLRTMAETGARRQRAATPCSRRVLLCSDPLSLRTLNTSLSVSNSAAAAAFLYRPPSTLFHCRYTPARLCSFSR
ncbi:hypothetical protein PIB30_071770, partial [Stylosanthes scabra]|nr:hypothetical protein [Stylosanthes scabra]